MRKGKPTHRAELLNESDFTIIATYQLEYRGLVNYYQMAYNLHTLSKLKWVMEASLTKTLAYKHKCSVNKVYGKYQVGVPVAIGQKPTLRIGFLLSAVSLPWFHQ